jgi:hypothetical protein
MDEGRQFDVIVIGGGGSGLAAAASAAEHGARVLLLEKQPELGGSTGMAVGSFTTSRTVYQEKAGIEDSAEDHIEDAAMFAAPELEARNNHALRRFFLSHSSESLKWLKGMGIDFHGPSPEPPNRVARMHNVVPSAKAYIVELERKLRRCGGTILCDAPAKKILKEDHRAVGVLAEPRGEPTEFRAAKGVVLGAGDYSSAPDLIAKYKGEEYAAIEAINVNCHGDGHRLAKDAGAQLVNMDVTYGPELRFIPPEKKGLIALLPTRGIFRRIMGKLLPLTPKPIMNAVIKRQLVTWQHPENALFNDGAILVNCRGDRFCNEKATPEREIAIAEQPGKTCYILLDRRLIELYSDWPHFVSTAPEIAYAYVEDYLRLRPDVSVSGPDLGSVAEARGLSPENLSAAVASFSESVSGRAEDAFGRTGDAHPLDGDRWVLLGPAKSYFTMAEGSPAVDLDCRVLDPSGRPIGNLYAVGNNGLGGQILWGHGLHIAWAITSGRLVGKALAKK